MKNILRENMRRFGTKNLVTINEAITHNNVQLSAANKQGGPVVAKYNNIISKYSVVVDTAAYDGPVGVAYIYSKNEKFYIKTNKDQEFKIPKDKLSDIVNKIKKGSKIIKIVTGTYPLDAAITFTKK